MKWNEAAAAIKTVPRTNKPWKPNPSITIDQAVGVVEAAINEALENGEGDKDGPYWLEKRVAQVCRNQRRPKLGGQDYCPSCGMLRSQCDCWDAVNQA